jgi:hypothetical protein
MVDLSRWRRDSRLPFQELQGQAVVVVPARREMHELDETATFLWNELAKDRSVEDLVDALCAEFEVEPARADKDVRLFLAALEEKGLGARA